MSPSGLFDYLAASDRRICGRLARWSPGEAVLQWMVWSSRVGDGWHWLAAGLLLLAGGPAQWPRLSAVSVSAGLANTAVVLLKRRVRRRRPGSRPVNCLLGAIARDWSFDEYSFPSGHALNAFALATTLGLAIPATAPLLFALAVSIALSRLVLGAHFPTDVAAGALIGAVAGAVAFVAVFH